MRPLPPVPARWLSTRPRARPAAAEMAAAPALFERRLHAVLTKLVLQLQEIFDSLLIVSVYRHPFGTLSPWVDRVEADGDLTRQVTFEILFGERDLLAIRSPRPVVVMTTGFRMRPIRLARVGAAVHKPPRVLGHHLRHCLHQIRHIFSYTAFGKSPSEFASRAAAVRRQGFSASSRSRNSRIFWRISAVE